MTNPLIESRDAFAKRHPEQRITLNGRDWGFLDIGDGPALILIPGTLGRSDIFWQQIDALSGQLRILSTSYPDSGGVADWANDIVVLMDARGIERATILGSSLGGFLAQYVAGARPDRVDQLIAANTLHSVDGLDQRPPYAFDLENTPINTLRDGFGTGLERWRELHPDQSDLVDLLLMEVGGHIPEPELRRRLAALKHGPVLPASGVPTDHIFTIEAQDDPLIPEEVRRAVRDRLTPTVAYVFKDGGHFLYVAKPKVYTALLQQIMGLDDSTGPDWGTGRERVL